MTMHVFRVFARPLSGGDNNSFNGEPRVVKSPAARVFRHVARTHVLASASSPVIGGQAYRLPPSTEEWLDKKLLLDEKKTGLDWPQQAQLDDDDDDDDTMAFRRVLQRDAIPTASKQYLTVQILSKLNETVPITRRLTLWAQPPQITILAHVGEFLPQTSCRRVCERHGVIHSLHSRTRT